jgi:hypothetical protein
MILHDTLAMSLKLTITLRLDTFTKEHCIWELLHKEVVAVPEIINFNLLALWDIVIQDGLKSRVLVVVCITILRERVKCKVQGLFRLVIWFLHLNDLITIVISVTTLCFLTTIILVHFQWDLLKGECFAELKMSFGRVKGALLTKERLLII